MVNQCCVEACKNTSKDCPLHRFPYLDKEVFEIWVSRINNSKIKSLDPHKVNVQYRVCHNHFSHHCLLPKNHRSNRRLLKARSLPTLNLPGFHEESTLENSILPWLGMDKNTIQVEPMEVREAVSHKDIDDKSGLIAGPSLIATRDSEGSVIVSNDNINAALTTSPVTTQKARKDKQTTNV